MKKSIFLTLLLAVFAISVTSAQSVDKILDKHFETIGQKKLKKVKSIQSTGRAMVSGMDAGLTMIQKRPDKLRMSIEIQGSEVLQVYDGETAWSVNPFMGSAAAVEMTGPEADGIIETSDMDGQLWNYKEKGHQLVLDGTEEVEGTEAYVLKLTKKNGNIDYYYLDKDSYLIVKLKTKTIVNGSEMEVEALMSNYQDVDGYLVPFTLEQKIAGQAIFSMMLEEVKLDVEIDDAIFSKPSGN